MHDHPTVSVRVVAAEDGTADQMPGVMTAMMSVLDAAEHPIRRKLPALPADIVVYVTTGSSVVPGTGLAAWTRAENILISLNPEDPRGVLAVVDQDVSSAFAHEAHHLTRLQGLDEEPSLIVSAVFEGLGTVFEREFSGRTPPWGDYDRRVIADWTSELLLLPESAATAEWLFSHPDGRRWIAYRVGTYIVDRACAETAATAASLVLAPTEAILTAAGFAA